MSASAETPYKRLMLNEPLLVIDELLERWMYKSGIHLKRERGSSYEDGFIHGLETVLGMLKEYDPETVRRDLQRYISEHENPAPRA